MPLCKFYPGDVVRSLGGGPKMTISHIYDKYIYVLWFDTSDHLHRGQFEADVLYPIKQETS